MEKVEIEASVVSGFEAVASYDISEKFDVNVTIGQGRVYFWIELKYIEKVDLFY